ncbi:NADPH-adrenodoxin reductase [Marasmius tenuissimus]|nr:NADPH-adrenodoxin reductase [Marasmius tenuissimus]
MKLGIIGGGPSGFYVASRILSRTSRPLRIDVYDRLWCPHGLVRYGVAPDHPEVKNCVHKFDQAASDSRLRFFGNVNIGSTGGFGHNLQLPTQSLLKNYTHLLLATGCTRPRLHPSLPPQKDVVLPALDVVHWYTAHPSNASPPPLDKVKHVSIIGLGNVSLDVARILLMSPEELAPYDVPESVLDVLRRSTIEHVSIVGRRGPLEAAFTTKELREMMNLSEARSKNTDSSSKKTWSLEFYRNPLEIAPSHNSHAHGHTLTLGHTEVDKTTGKAVPTGLTTQLPTDLVITSLGFHGESFTLPSSSSSSMSTADVDLYSPTLGYLRTISPTNRLVSPTPSGHILKHMYASGWAAMGAKGVLAATMMDAYNVADEGILKDVVMADQEVESGKLEEELLLNPDESSVDLDSLPSEIEKGLLEGSVTTYEDWRKVDEEERGRAKEGKERERMLSWEEVTKYLRR